MLLVDSVFLDLIEFKKLFVRSLRASPLFEFTALAPLLLDYRCSTPVAEFFRTEPFTQLVLIELRLITVGWTMPSLVSRQAIVHRLRVASVLHVASATLVQGSVMVMAKAPVTRAASFFVVVVGHVRCLKRVQVVMLLQQGHSAPLLTLDVVYAVEAFLCVVRLL